MIGIYLSGVVTVDAWDALFWDQFVLSPVYDDRVHANVNNTRKFGINKASADRLIFNKRLVGGSMFELLFLVKQLPSSLLKEDHFDDPKRYGLATANRVYWEQVLFV